jgi:hypothetical protein
MDDEIVVMCQSMANLLRYISADSEQLVPLNTELSYTENYLTCMIICYQEDLTYSIEVHEEMREVKIPKLCIQLLVENAIKFSTTIKSPWHIKIKGSRTAVPTSPSLTTDPDSILKPSGTSKIRSGRSTRALSFPPLRSREWAS